eukprot:3474668-Amphidinium_carterae.1
MRTKWEPESVRPQRDFMNCPPPIACTTPVAAFNATRKSPGGPVPPQPSDPAAGATAPPLTS